MLETDFQTVKRQPVKAEALAEETVQLPLAVAYITDQGMAQVLEVTSYLVHPAGV